MTRADGLGILLAALVFLMLVYLAVVDQAKQDLGSRATRQGVVRAALGMQASVS